MSKIKNAINKKKAELSNRLAPFFEKIGGLTKGQRLLICLCTFVLIGGAYYYFIFMPKHDELKKAKEYHQQQVTTLSIYKSRAAAIKKYEKLMIKTKEAFAIAMKALPDKREIPSLLTGISNAGTNAGLVFHLFQPNSEVDKEFIKEIPVSIKVVGQYHQFTDFFYQIIKLNRIVNINNVDVQSDPKKGGKELEMSCKAVTYMFVEQDESKNKKKRK